MNLKQYLENGGDPNIYDDMGQSLLHHYRHQYENVKLLLDYGANPNQYALQNITSLTLCCYDRERINHAKLLVEYGAKLDLRSTRDNTILHEVSDACHELIPFFIQKGADLNAENQYNDTPLSYALRWQKFQVAIELLKHKPKMSKDCLYLLKCRMPIVYSRWIRTKWILIKCAMKLLSLHKRAVITANHPLRKFERGEFLPIMSHSSDLYFD